MDHKEKAKALVEEFKSFAVTVEGCEDRRGKCIIHSVMFTQSAKQCAIIAVDEIIKAEPIEPSKFNMDYDESLIVAMRYWKQVRKEIEQL